MTQLELNDTLTKTLNIPIAYGKFDDDRQMPPYLVFYRDENENIKADDVSYAKFEHIIVELYVKHRNLEIERKIEQMLEENDIPFEVDEAYVSEEKLRIIKYYFYVNKEE